MLIRIKLLLAEYMAKGSEYVNEERLEAIDSIKKLISAIDFEAETVPMENEDRVISLLVSLKGEVLSPEEIKLTKELLK